MPIYEYRCQDCGRRMSMWVMKIGGEPDKPCPRCGSHNLVKLISRVSTLRSADSDGDDMPAALSDMSNVDENDPRSIARWARKLGKELGEDAGPELDEMLDRMEAGEMPDEGDGGDSEDFL